VPESFPVVDVVNRAVARGHRDQQLSVMAPLVEGDLCICRGTSVIGLFTVGNGTLPYWC
jgi:hypothetical protein